MGQVVLTGPHAFFKQPDYQEATRRDFAVKGALKNAAFRYETESKVIRVAKIIFAIIIFPVGIYWGLHALIGKIVVPATLYYDVNFGPGSMSPGACRIQGFDANQQDPELAKWKMKRVTVEVNGTAIDALVVGHEDTLGNNRWVLHSHGNGMRYEPEIGIDKYDLEMERGHIAMLKKLKANVVFFNYPGSGDSQGATTRPELINCYKGMLKFLETELGAKEIIGHGHSIGGGIQGEALETYQLNKDIKYVFIKDRTFHDLSAAIEGLLGKALAFLAKVFSWNIQTVESSKKLQVPEIIVQAGSKNAGPGGNIIELTKDDVTDDQLISKEAACATKVLTDPAFKVTPKRKVVTMNMARGHMLPLTWRQLGDLVEQQLRLA